MKNAFSYIASVFVSVILVFSVLAGTGAGIVKYCATEQQFKTISEKHDIDDKVRSELEKYFHERSSVTGIPEEVYMDAIDSEYIHGIIEQTIDNGFQRLRGGNASIETKNEKLEASIDAFFNDYADKTGYKKDDKFEKKLTATKNSSYSIIREYSDVYKFGALDSHGIITKLSKIYTRIDLIMITSASAVLILIIVLLLINMSAKAETVYWTGVSALIAGAIGTAPCAYLLASNYFSSFSIKQAQIYTSYTETMKLFTNTFMYASIGIAVLGLLLIIIYAVFRPKKTQAA